MKKIFLSLLVIFSFSIYAFLAKKSTLAAVLFSFSHEDPIVSLFPTEAGKYKDGEYLGDVEDAFYGNIQVKAIVQNGRISEIFFLEYPQDRLTSRQINERAIPLLKSEAIQAQSAKVDIVSGATDSGIAFKKSLESALEKALP